MLLPNLGVQPQQPQFPQVNANVNTMGIQLAIVLAPGISFNINIGPQMVEQWLAMWEQQRGQRELEARAVQSAQNGSLHG